MDGPKDILIHRAELELFGISRHAKARAFKTMEAAGLVTLARARGKSPRVTICVCPDTSTSTAPQSPPDAARPLSS
jgi:hypothetical protein